MRSRLTNIELTIFGFFASLTVKAVLDTAYDRTVPLLTTPSALYHAAWSPVSIQVIVMVFTFMRFLYGVYRLHEGHNELDALETWVKIWITPSLLVLLILFYIAGLCVQNPEAFYGALIGVHAWDTVAFVLPMAASPACADTPSAGRSGIFCCWISSPSLSFPPSPWPWTTPAKSRTSARWPWSFSASPILGGTMTSSSRPKNPFRVEVLRAVQEIS